MATIDLGKIKLVWRGTYSGSTAYTVDDVVQYTDSGLVSSYICTTNSTGNAPSSSGTAHGSWAYLAKGHADTVSTTLSTQGDVLYRDGSGLQRLAKPASNKFLQNTSGGVVSWETLSSDWVRLGGGTSSGMVAAYSIDSLFTADYDIYKIFVNRIFGSSAGQGLRYRYNSSAGTPQTGSNYRGVFDGSYWNNSGSSGQQLGGNWSSDHFGYSNVSTNQDEFGDMDITLFNPVSASIKTSSIVTGGGFESNHIYTRHQRGIYNVNEAHTGITVYAGSGNITVESCQVFGLKNS